MWEAKARPGVAQIGAGGEEEQLEEEAVSPSWESGSQLLRGRGVGGGVSLLRGLEKEAGRGEGWGGWAEGGMRGRPIPPLILLLEHLPPTLHFRGKVELMRLICPLPKEPETGCIFQNILIKLTNKYSTLCRLPGQRVETRGPSFPLGPSGPLTERRAVLWAGLGLGLLAGEGE